MTNPSTISLNVSRDFPLGTRVRLNPAHSGRFAPLAWRERIGEVVGYAQRHGDEDGPFVLLRVVWPGRTRRRVNQAHHSHFERVG